MNSKDEQARIALSRSGQKLAELPRPIVQAWYNKGRADARRLQQKIQELEQLRADTVQLNCPFMTKCVDDVLKRRTMQLEELRGILFMFTVFTKVEIE